MSMLIDVVKEHLIEVVKVDGPFPSDEAAYSYIENCLNEGALAYAIDASKKATQSTTQQLEHLITIH